MEKEIQYTGLSNLPSDYQCSDGELDLAFNLINENGELKPLLLPGVLLAPKGEGLASGALGAVILVHKLSSGRENYISYNNGTTALYCFYKGDNDRWVIPKDGSKPLPIVFLGSSLISSAIVGNTLVIATEKGLRYLLWSDDKYIDLGSDIPEFPLQFALKGINDADASCCSNPSFPMTNEELSSFSTLSEARKKEISNQLVGLTDKLIATAHEKGYFIFPFFIRYAFKLYDGSYSKLSAPVLMRPVIGQNPYFSIRNTTDNSRKYITVQAVLSQIHCSTPEENGMPDTLRNWSDIVKGIDIFVSSPIFTFNQEADIDDLTKCPTSYCTCDFGSSAGYPRKGMWAMIDSNGYQSPQYSLPQKDSAAIASQINISSANYYLVKSLSLDNLFSYPLSFNDDIKVDNNILNNLSVQTRLPDDANSRDKIIPKRLFQYNQRLAAADITRVVAPGADIAVALQNLNETGYSGDYIIRPYVLCKRNGTEYALEGTPRIRSSVSAPVFFHTCSDAYALLLLRAPYTGQPRESWKEVEPTSYAKIPLSEHSLLNAVSSDVNLDARELDWKNYSEGILPPDAKSTLSIDLSNRIYLSEVQNPFVFPLSHITAVGLGRIFALSSAAKALSQGQFGEFPLYAFTSEGVWALSIASNGAFAARQPISRDVLLNPDSLVQIDSSVLFATSRGLMQISGSNVHCVSEKLSSQHISIPKLGFSHSFAMPEVSFNEYIANCRMAYDYAGQKIIVFNPGYEYSYCFSLKSALWSLLGLKFKYSVNAYPRALISDYDDNLREFGYKEALPFSSPYKELLVTRPLKLDAHDILKTVRSVVQRGLFKRGNVKSVLYGSRDLRNWHLVWSSTDHSLRGFGGTPYKYFRLVVPCNLDVDEVLYGASVVFDAKFTNQLR